VINVCQGCLEKQRKIDQLLEEIQRLKAQLRYQEKKEEEGYFGSSTPSSKKPFKPNSEEEKRRKKGGALLGHKGYGRKSHSEETADEVIPVEMGDICPECGGELRIKRVKDRSVIDIEVQRPKKILYRLIHKECTRCHRVYRAKAPGVLPKSLYGNKMIAKMAVMHYYHGIPMGRVSNILGVKVGSMVKIFHRLAGYFSPVIEVLKMQYRQADVKHADETSWRIDGKSGYAWLFCNTDMSLFYFKDTRSASVPREVFGEERLPGVLVVDRYKAYNKLPVLIQYCYSHINREVEDLLKEFEDSEEVKAYVEALTPLLSEAMGLRNQPISDEEYYKRARRIKKEIQRINRAPAKHLGIRSMQEFFNNNEDRLYHWVEDRRVPPDNNLCESNLRPTVVSRKVSFGSSSEEGAKTRSILMSVIHTLNKRRGDEPLESVFNTLLDRIAENPAVDITTFFPLPKPIPP
jgi:transposase-like protein